MGLEEATRRPLCARRKSAQQNGTALAQDGSDVTRSEQGSHNSSRAQSLSGPLSLTGLVNSSSWGTTSANASFSPASTLPSVFETSFNPSSRPCATLYPPPILPNPQTKLANPPTALSTTRRLKIHPQVNKKKASPARMQILSQ